MGEHLGRDLALGVEAQIGRQMLAIDMLRSPDPGTCSVLELAASFNTTDTFSHSRLERIYARAKKTRDRQRHCCRRLPSLTMEILSFE